VARVLLDAIARQVLLRRGRRVAGAQAVL
jgi:hypothetical protein